MKELEKLVLGYLKERDWDQLRPSDMAKSIMIEGAELLELFQWENLPLKDVRSDPEKLARVKEELADVLIYGLEMSILLGLDTEKIIRQKLAAAAKKYPVSLVKNREGREPGTEKGYWQLKKKYRTVHK